MTTEEAEKDGAKTAQINAQHEKIALQKPWTNAPVTFTEVIDLLEKRSALEERRQERLVELGDRETVYEPTMREAYVFGWLANWLRKRQLDMQKEHRRYGR